MRGVVLTVMFVGVFTLLVVKSSFWVAFGTFYLTGLVLVAVAATLGRIRGAATQRYDDPARAETLVCNRD